MDKTQELQILLQTLGDSNRLRIIRFIGNQSKSVSEIVDEMKLSQPLVSHHLKALRDKNILTTKREGPFIYYELKDLRLLEVLGLFEKILESSGFSAGQEEYFACPSWMREYWMKR